MRSLYGVYRVGPRADVLISTRTNRTAALSLERRLNADPAAQLHFAVHLSAELRAAILRARGDDPMSAAS